MPPRLRHAHVTDELRARIRSGDLAPGDRLPSEARLMVDHGIARMTARSILDPLVAEGLAHRVHGSGTYAGPPPGTVAVVLHLTPHDYARLAQAAHVAAVGGLEPAEWAARAVLSALDAEPPLSEAANAYTPRDSP